MSTGCHVARNLQRARSRTTATNALGLYDSRTVGGLIGSVAVVNFDVHGFASRKARDIPVKRAALFYCPRAHACRRTRRIRGCSSRWQCRRGKSRGYHCPGQHRDETNSAYCLQDFLPTHDHLFFKSGLVTLVLTDCAVGLLLSRANSAFLSGHDSHCDRRDCRNQQASRNQTPIRCAHG